MEKRDIPIETLQDDEFGVSRFVEALCGFIRSSGTPLTVALQGEWGCGKTSFMKLIESTLCDPALPESERFESIWLSTWELFLESDYDTAVKKLVINLLDQLERHFDKLDNAKKEEKRRRLAREYLRSISTTVLSMTKMNNDFSEKVVDNLFSKDSQNENLQKLKREFESYLMEEVKNKDNGLTGKAFLIFVDDLDRLEPKLALTLLEALKNLFDIRCCIFVMAIDYEVVEYGVEQKYGRRSIKNRNIAKDFFDKIIQVPYVVPMMRYRINSMVISRLKQIRFFDLDYDYTKFEPVIVEIVTLATNKNPRAIKRLLNMTQLTLALEAGEERHHGAYRIMELFLLSLQLSFPAVCDMLMRNNDLERWKTSFYVRSGREITEHDRSQYKLDAEWKEVIFLAVSEDEVAQRNYPRIARLLEIYERIQVRCKKVNEKVQEAMGIVNVVRMQEKAGAPASYYDGESYDRSSQTQFRQGEHLLELLELFDHENVLDLGCGNGSTTLELWKRNMDMRISAFDISEGQIRKAKENYEKFLASCEGQEHLGGIDFYVQDALALRDREAYDLIFSNATLHWVMNPKKMHRLMFDALVPSGTLAIHQGGVGTYRELHEIALQAGKNIGVGDKLKKEAWLFPAYYPPKEELYSILQDAGYEDIQIESVETDESGNENLVDNFANASLIYYRSAGLTEEEYRRLREEYFRLCGQGGLKMTAHRLYAVAKKPRAAGNGGG